MANANRTVLLENLEPSCYFIKGTLTYSRLTRRIDGDELINDQKRRVAIGQQPRQKAYTTATVKNAIVIPTGPNGTKTPVDIYGEESFYQSATNDTPNFTGENSSPNQLPWIGVSFDGGKTVDQIKPEGELDVGNEVILVMRVYKNKKINKTGRSLDGVIVLGEPKYYSGPTNLSQYGITFNPLKDDSVTADNDPSEVTTPAAPQVPAQQAPQQANPFQQSTPFSNPGSPFGGMGYTPNE